VANSVPDDAQLEQLLTQLLRAVSPAFAAARPENGAVRPVGAVLTGSSTPAYAARDAAGASHADAGEPGLPDPVGAKLPSVSGSEARALIELVSARGIAQGELAGLLGLDKSTVSRLAAGLERKGWVRRGRDEVNQRYVRLYLTPEGGDVAARVLGAWHSRQARILAALSDDERAGLSAGLRGLVRGLAAEGLLTRSADHDK
jgi:DNA-binding MarR family transcriptional regulator